MEQQHEALAELFEAHRDRLRTVAHRMLGSLPDADDAVQETWLRLARGDASAIVNPAGWLTTVISRICLDMLRSREARREEPAGHPETLDHPDPTTRGDPEREALLADSAGRALLVVLDRLSPAERVAFVLHDVLAVPFDQAAAVVDRSTAAAKQLASRARRKVRGTPAVPADELFRRRRVIEAFLAASRSGDIDAVLAVLAPDVVRTADRAALPGGRPSEVRGAREVAGEVAVFGRNARFAEVALVDGVPGIVVAPHGRLRLVLTVTVEGDRVAGYRVVADPLRLRDFDLAVLDHAPARG
ncbi:sigma-70 family RNA polymerase sigma factor [Streptomyces albus subsp. chlorinus]|uniref:sigma-70 family RNA polymerase sigma factor n=1 Tax=Streptomyces albus TaxID=1888 RepID=UPI00156D806A|nr:sigma-70 family RNA polymerase sigma factor [Streptomyces albus subsp. chlorinus]